MRENGERGSLLIDTVKSPLKISGRRAKRYFDTFRQTSSERWFKAKLLARTLIQG